MRWHPLITSENESDFGFHNFEKKPGFMWPYSQYSNVKFGPKVEIVQITYSNRKKYNAEFNTMAFFINSSLQL